MKTIGYILLGLLSCVEVLAEQAAFDKAVEAYRIHQKAKRTYSEAIDAHEETRIASATYRAIDLTDSEAYEKAKLAFEKARDENKEVKGAYAIYQITAHAYDKALHEIEEIKLAFVLWEKAKQKVENAQRADNFNYATWKKADAAWEEATDIYTAVQGVFHDAVKKVYEQGEKTH